MSGLRTKTSVKMISCSTTQWHQPSKFCALYHNAREYASWQKFLEEAVMIPFWKERNVYGLAHSVYFLEILDVV